MVQAEDNSKAGVKDRHPQHEEGDNKGDNGVKFEQALDTGHGHHITQQGGTGVPHKNLGGRPVIGQEADAAPGQGAGDDGHTWIGIDQGDDDQAHAGDGRHASRQAVQAVNQIDGIGDEDNPEQGDGDGQDAQIPVPAQGHQAAEKVDLVAAQHRHSGSRQLHHQLFHSRQVVDVIKDP